MWEVISELIMNGRRLLMNCVMARNTRGSETARRDDLEQGLWNLTWMRSCSKFLTIGVNWGH